MRKYRSALVRGSGKQGQEYMGSLPVVNGGVCVSRGDLSPYDLDLGSGRVHTHSHTQRFFSERAAREELEFCLLSFFLNALSFVTVATVFFFVLENRATEPSDTSCRLP